MTKDLLIIWVLESSARVVDESISDVVDANAPVELIEPWEISDNGYDLILAGDESPENIENVEPKSEDVW